MPPKSPLPQWIPPQLTQLVEAAPFGSKWLHEIKLDGFRMAGRIERGKARLLTRTGLDWSAKYPSLLSALAAVRAKTAYLDGELCSVGEDGLPNFAETQAATDGARGVRLVLYAFDLLHLAAAPRRAFAGLLYGRRRNHLPRAASGRACPKKCLRICAAVLTHWRGRTRP